MGKQQKKSTKKKQNKKSTQSSVSVSASASENDIPSPPPTATATTTRTRCPLFGIGGSARPSIEPGRKAIIYHLQSRPHLNSTHCTIQKILRNGRVAVEVSNNNLRNIPEFQDTEIIALLPTKLEMIWEIKKKGNGNGNDNDNIEDNEIQELCPICCESVMVINETSSLFSCCGGMICNQCFVKHTYGGVSVNPDRCPLCRADTSDTSDAAELARVRERAHRGNANACYNLGGYYDAGRYGIPQDQTKARYWYQKAAMKGEERAAHNLACCYRDGEGGSIDHAVALKYFKMSAEGGHIPGITNLGLAYMRGDGLSQPNLQEAEKWLRKGSNRGDQLATQQLEVLQMIKETQQMNLTNPNVACTTSNYGDSSCMFSFTAKK